MPTVCGRNWQWVSCEMRKHTNLSELSPISPFNTSLILNDKFLSKIPFKRWFWITLVLHKFRDAFTGHSPPRAFVGKLASNDEGWQTNRNSKMVERTTNSGLTSCRPALLFHANRDRDACYTFYTPCPDRNGNLHCESTINSENDWPFGYWKSRSISENIFHISIWIL